VSWLDQRPDDAMMGSFEAVSQEHIELLSRFGTHLSDQCRRGASKLRLVVECA